MVKATMMQENKRTGLEEMMATGYHILRTYALLYYMLANLGHTLSVLPLSRSMNDSKNPEGLTTMADAKASNGGSKREKGTGH
jgi:hypothetical protein